MDRYFTATTGTTATITWVTAADSTACAIGAYWYPQSPNEKIRTDADSEREEGERRKNKPLYTGKILALLPAHYPTGTVTEGLCVREDDTHVCCLPAEEGEESCPERSYLLDLRYREHYKVMEAYEDPPRIGRILRAYSSIMMNPEASSKLLPQVRKNVNVLHHAMKLSLPDSASPFAALPRVDNGRIVLSQRLQELIGTAFCGEYQRKATPVIKEVMLEMLHIVWMMLNAKQNEEAKETVKAILGNTNLSCEAPRLQISEGEGNHVD